MSRPLRPGHRVPARAPGAHVARGPRRELISRSYNTDPAHRLRAKVRATPSAGSRRSAPTSPAGCCPRSDDGWFFDTELLLLADHNGLRVHELPVDWVDDPDSRVDVVGTALGDLAGTARMARRFLTGRGQIDLAGSRAARTHDDDIGRRLVTFGVIGAVSTAVSLVLFLLLRPAVGPLGGQRRRAGSDLRGQRLGERPLHGAAPTGPLAPGGGDVLVSVALSTAALLMAVALGAGPAVEVVVLLASWLAASMARLALVDGWTGRDGRP